MRDSYLMGLQLFLLMLLSQTAWERLVRRDPKAGSPRTASSATAAAGLEGRPLRGGEQGAQGPRPPLPASACLGPGAIPSPRWEKGTRALGELFWESFATGEIPPASRPAPWDRSDGGVLCAVW